MHHIPLFLSLSFSVSLSPIPSPSAEGIHDPTIVQAKFASLESATWVAATPCDRVWQPRSPFPLRLSISLSLRVPFHRCSRPLQIRIPRGPPHSYGATVTYRDAAIVDSGDVQ